jgi:putative redox protein
MAEKTQATLVWQQELLFSARSGSGFEIAMDSPIRPDFKGASPMEIVLMGIAGCMAMDVVSIMGKMKQELKAVTIEVAGERAPNHPKIFTAIELVYKLTGRGLEREKALRAIDLSRTTYCSAINTLRPDCTVRTSVELVEG